MKLILVLLFLSASCLADIHDVSVQDNNFSPANLSIQAGDTVRWENYGNMNHNVLSQNFNYPFRCANGCEDNGGNGTPAGTGWVSEVTFHRPSNNIPYVCEPHIGFGMTGSITVQTPTVSETVTVNMSNGFQPQEVTIFTGQRLLFSNGNGEHNIKADDDSFQCADGCRDDGIEGYEFWTGYPWQVFKVFSEPGTITYHCENPAHNESGTIHVIDEPPIFANGFESI